MKTGRFRAGERERCSPLTLWSVCSDRLRERTEGKEMEGEKKDGVGRGIRLD